MTEQELYQIAHKKPALTDAEINNAVTSQDVNNMVNEAWTKSVNLLESYYASNKTKYPKKK